MLDVLDVHLALHYGLDDVHSFMADDFVHDWLLADHADLWVIDMSHIYVVSVAAGGIDHNLISRVDVLDIARADARLLQIRLKPSLLL